MSDTGRENDPFAAFESDRTVIKPGAGRGAQPGAPGAPQARPGRGAPPAARRADAGGGKEAPLALDALMSASLNPLVAAAVAAAELGAAHPRDGAASESRRR